MSRSCITTTWRRLDTQCTGNLFSFPVSLKAWLSHWDFQISLSWSRTAASQGGGATAAIHPWVPLCARQVLRPQKTVGDKRHETPCSLGAYKLSAVRGHDKQRHVSVTTGGLSAMKNKKEAAVGLCFWKGLGGEEAAVSVEERHTGGGKSHRWGSEAGRCTAITQQLVLEDGCATRQHESGGQLFRAAGSSVPAARTERAQGHSWKWGKLWPPREGEGPTVQGGIWVWGQSLQHLSSLLQPGPEAAVWCGEKGLRTKGKQARVSSSSRRSRFWSQSCPNTPKVLLRHPDWAGVPVNLAWLRRACCVGQASTTGSPEKPQAPERPVLRFQACKAEPFLESYRPYDCRVTRASSDNQMAHLSLLFF